MSKSWLLIIKESCSNPYSRTWIFLDFRFFEETIVVNKLFCSRRAIHIGPFGGGWALWVA